MSDEHNTPEAIAVREWNRLVTEQIKAHPQATPADALRFEGCLMLGHALVIGLTCIASAIRGHS
jgi:hypothetical protein